MPSDLESSEALSPWPGALLLLNSVLCESAADAECNAIELLREAVHDANETVGSHLSVIAACDSAVPCEALQVMQQTIPRAIAGHLRVISSCLPRVSRSPVGLRCAAYAWFDAAFSRRQLPYLSLVAATTASCPALRALVDAARSTTALGLVRSVAIAHGGECSHLSLLDMTVDGAARESSSACDTNVEERAGRRAVLMPALSQLFQLGRKSPQRPPQDFAGLRVLEVAITMLSTLDEAERVIIEEHSTAGTQNDRGSVNPRGEDRAGIAAVCEEERIRRRDVEALALCGGCRLHCSLHEVVERCGLEQTRQAEFRDMCSALGLAVTVLLDRTALAEESCRWAIASEQQHAFADLAAVSQRARRAAEVAAVESRQRAKLSVEMFAASRRLLQEGWRLSRWAVEAPRASFILSVSEEKMRQWLALTESTDRAAVAREGRRGVRIATLAAMLRVDAEQQRARVAIEEVDAMFWQRAALERQEADARHGLHTVVVEVKSRMGIRMVQLKMEVLFDEYRAFLKESVLPALELLWRREIEKVWERTTLMRLEAGMPQMLRGPFVAMADSRRDVHSIPMKHAASRGTAVRHLVLATRAEREKLIADLSTKCRKKPRGAATSQMIGPQDRSLPLLRLGASEALPRIEPIKDFDAVLTPRRVSRMMTQQPVPPRSTTTLPPIVRARGVGS